ncbi:hypothetical protein FGB62_364g02 [Gracilaria domingensis]|nr:hypothetical protein FGB62_364g02 [Gracilaria domingensis]
MNIQDLIAKKSFDDLPTSKSDTCDLLFRKTDGKFKISRNITAEQSHVLRAPPPYIPTHENKYASFINLEGYGLTEETFCELSPYSMRCKATRMSSVYILGNRVQVKRKSFLYSGVKCCATSVARCMEPHQVLWNVAKMESANSDTSATETKRSDNRAPKSSQGLFEDKEGYPT